MCWTIDVFSWIDGTDGMRCHFILRFWWITVIRSASSAVHLLASGDCPKSAWNLWPHGNAMRWLTWGRYTTKLDGIQCAHKKWSFKQIILGKFLSTIYPKISSPELKCTYTTVISPSCVECYQMIGTIISLYVTIKAANTARNFRKKIDSHNHCLPTFV